MSLQSPPSSRGIVRTYWKTIITREIHSFWNEDQDVLVLDSTWIISSIFRPRGFPLTQFFDKNMDMISMIRFLEVRIEDWSYYLEQYRVQNFATERVLPVLNRPKELGFEATFCDLKYEGPEKAENSLKCKIFFEEYFQKRILEERSCSVPNITILLEPSSRLWL